MTYVACCWDDGVETDIRLVELLHKYNARATFNINFGLHYKNYRRTCGWQFESNPSFVNKFLSLNEMPQIYRGFEIAAHGYFHADCAKVPTAEYVVDATDDRRALEDLFQQKVEGFVYGCGRYTKAAADALAAADFLYGRTTETANCVCDCGNPLLLSPSAHFLHAHFMDKFEQAGRSNGVFYFWGHSCEMQNDQSKWAALEEKLAAISATPAVQWINVADIVRKFIKPRK